MRPMGPSPSAEIVSFASTLLSSRAIIIRFSRLHIRSLQRSLFIRVVVFLLSAAMPLPTLAQAPSPGNWAFRFSGPVRWGDAVLTAGDYVLSVSTDQPPAVTVYQKSSGFTATITAQAATFVPASGSTSTRIFTLDSGAGNYVTSVYLKETGAMLTFALPEARAAVPTPNMQDPARQDAATEESTPEEGGLVAIHGPQSQSISYAQAEAIYRSACKVIEQEFSRTEPVRPRLTLILGASTNNVNYVKHEVQLTKWNKYEFAQGVVLLAADELLPLEKRLLLTKLAVLQSESTVDISELKTGRTLPHLRPQN